MIGMTLRLPVTALLAIGRRAGDDFPVREAFLAHRCADDAGQPAVPGPGRTRAVAAAAVAGSEPFITATRHSSRADSVPHTLTGGLS